LLADALHGVSAHRDRAPHNPRPGRANRPCRPLSARHLPALGLWKRAGGSLDGRAKAHVRIGLTKPLGARKAREGADRLTGQHLARRVHPARLGAKGGLLVPRLPVEVGLDVPDPLRPREGRGAGRDGVIRIVGSLGRRRLAPLGVVLTLGSLLGSSQGGRGGLSLTLRRLPFTPLALLLILVTARR